ncbi:SH3 domain-containing protein [Nocardioides eburneiflavus]|uniref:SH3 domain-containing protein n=1 Tax=Nocardioides eburneiflavus TaxID=2518372 RepID=A0A4Z1CJM5_9ACTN|nr:SH3 domain-containing protein [Nocardioides eburneiflavus]TGN64223.1 SH3 domain-containing protein [Nocardioides eburneiflavus]
MEITRALTAVGMTALCLTAAPAHAAGDAQVVIVMDDRTCVEKPDREAFPPAVRAISDGQAVAVGRAMEASGGYKYIQVLADGAKAECWLLRSTVSEPLGGALDPATYTREALVVDQDAGLPLAAVLTAGDMSVRVSPRNGADVLRELGPGEVLNVADWDILGGHSLVGADRWTPVNVDGMTGWVKTLVLASTEVITPDDLASTLTPSRGVEVREKPVTDAIALGALTAGQSYRADATATSGWYRVALDDATVGWVAQADLLTPAEEDSTATPTAEPTETPSWITDQQEKYDEWKAEREAEQTEMEMPATTETPSLWEKAKNAVTGENPAAEALAKGRLNIARIVALLALVLAALAHVATRLVRPGASLTGRLPALATSGLLPIVVHATAVAAIGAGLTAAFLAPSGYFDAQVLGGAAVVGAVLAFMTAHRVAAMRHAPADAVAATAKADSTLLLLVAGGAAAVTHLFLTAALPLAAVAGLVAAGAIAGSRTPIPTPVAQIEED